jgi:hypothetical protein
VADPPPPEFNVGDRVRVVSSARHLTPHTGPIRQVVWHFKHARYNYYIEENGKKVSTRYYADDLELVPSASASS